MLKIDRELCTGCGACEAICPVQAIKMKQNSEGFYYPEIDEKTCISCGKCNKICQIHQENIPTLNRKFYAVYAQDTEERSKSATGGMCACVAKYIIQNGGWFCGAAFYKGKLEHKLTNDFQFFDKYMRGSKYFQSSMGTVYGEIQEKLKQNITVAFIGTPCQVNGLRLFLGKSYDNLYLIDLICHGVPSQKAFNKFALDNKLNDILKKDVSVNFRDKKTGWHTSSFVIKNQKDIFYDRRIHDDPFCKAFLADICLRKSCYSCPYTQVNRVSDMMVGDFWGCPTEIDDNKGINLISVNKKGEDLLKSIHKVVPLVVKKYPVSQVMQPQLKNPTKEHFAREKFFELLDKMDFNELVDRTLNKEKRVGILNFFWENNNYGAILTAYALNKYINSIGYDAYNVDYTPRWGKNSLSTSNFPEFRKQNLPLTQKCENLDDLKSLNKNFGTFVVGSDQVFNYEFVRNDKDVYYLGFVDDANKKIAYSASFGQKQFLAPESEIDRVGLLLSRFNRIGIREKSGVNICRETFRSKATHVLDPVFLLSREEWAKIANPSIKFQKKIYYIVNEELNQEADKTLKDFHSVRYNLSIEDWLGTLMKTDFVLTDSFHALCFCLIFNKQFVYVGKDNGRQERVKSLFEMFDVPKSSFLIGRKLDSEFLLHCNKIDYQNFNTKLVLWLKISQDFLKNALCCENEKMYDPYYFKIKILAKDTSQQKKLKWKYLKYKILYKLSFGKRHKKYKQKYKNLKKMIRGE